MEGKILLSDRKRFTIEEYIENGGYEALKKALRMEPDEIVEEVKNSGLRGRGGAGFPTGLKWSFVPKDVSPKYLIVNADEGEPGTFKDREIMEKTPHLLLEGTLISAYAIGASKIYIYLRFEYPHIYRILSSAIEEAKRAGFIGEKILGSNFSVDVILFRGAGAYICGEETALIESIEGKRGNPRLRPPYPVTVGLFGKPTVVNNVETLSNVPFIVLNGSSAFREFGTEKSPGTKLFSISGAVERPGVYEFSMGSLTLKELVFDVAGYKGEGELFGVIPGGVSTCILRPEELDVPLDYESLQSAGTMLGSGAVIVLDRSKRPITYLRKMIEFFSHESCGKCTPCRDGLSWVYKILLKMEREGGNSEDLDLLLELAHGIIGNTFCPLGDGAAQVLRTFIKKYRGELLSPA